jgi:hypothetical protein
MGKETREMLKKILSTQEEILAHLKIKSGGNKVSTPKQNSLPAAKKQAKKSR